MSHATDCPTLLQLQAQAERDDGGTQAKAAQAAANEAHDAAMRRLKADLQRKAALLAAAKSDAEKHLAAAQAAQQALEKHKGDASKQSEPLQAARTELSAAKSNLQALAGAVRALSAVALGAAAGMHAGAQ